jgi:acetoin:2,6-dichlorophenolindophenol oxidoreductase subunit beta
MSRMTFAKALRDAMSEEMRKDDKVILMGLDVGAYGNAFGVTKGMFEEFGGDRILDMPISEAGYVGAAVGAAATGMRPIAEVQFADWVTIATDQICNQAANMRYMSGGAIKLPMVVRLAEGGYVQAAAQHSHMWESWFAFVPGLKVVIPSTPADAKGLLKASIRDNNPVLFFEHKRLYDDKGEVPDEADFVLPIGKADIKKQGKDISIITYSYMVKKALEAAKILEKDGISAEIVDLRTIKPLDSETIVNSVKKTGRALCFQETWLTCSVMAEVAAVIAEQAMDYLVAPLKRLGAKEVPVPFSPDLENYVLPQTEDVVRTVKAMLGKDTKR